MIQIGGAAGTILAWIVVTLAAAGGDAPRAAGRLIVSPDASTMWVLSSDGRLFKGAATAAEPWPGGDDLPRLADIDLAANAGALFALAESGDGKLTEIISLDAATGGTLGRWRIRGRGRALHVSPDASLACVIGTKPRAARPPRPGDWILTVVDLAGTPQGTEAGERVFLGFEPSAAGLVPGGPEGGEARLLVATTGRIASFTLDPPQSSWFYLSPGDNRDMTMTDDGSVLFLLRDGRLAVINPELRPEERGRGQLADDDATSTLPLSGPATALGLSSDGRAVAILHGGTGRISLIDTFTGEAIGGPEPVPGVDLIPRRFPHRQGEPLSLPMASSGAGGSAISIATRTVALADLPEIAPEPEAPAEPASEQEVPAPEPMTAPPVPKAAEPEPQPVAPRPVLQPVQPPPLPEPPAATPAPERESAEPAPPPEPSGPPEEPVDTEPSAAPPAPEEKPAGAEAVPEPQGPAKEVEESTSAAPERPDTEGPLLEGRVTGAGDLQVEVLAYGPDNILKLHARAKVAPDGSWRMALPPPGGYRLVVTGGGQTQLFTSPQFRRVEVSGEPATLAGLDFEIRGKL